MKSKLGKIAKVFLIISLFMLSVTVTACGGGSAETVSEPAGPSLEYGELLELTDNRDSVGVVVVKAKISPSYSNDATVKQNYYNVEDLIKNQGFDACELQYWAVADMTNGDEMKVVSFTVPADLVKSIAAGDVVANELGDKVDDLYIHASLR